MSWGAAAWLGRSSPPSLASSPPSLASGQVDGAGSRGPEEVGEVRQDIGSSGGWWRAASLRPVPAEASELCQDPVPCVLSGSGAGTQEPLPGGLCGGHPVRHPGRLSCLLRGRFRIPQRPVGRSPFIKCGATASSGRFPFSVSHFSDLGRCSSGAPFHLRSGTWEGQVPRALLLPSQTPGAHRWPGPRCSWGPGAPAADCALPEHLQGVPSPCTRPEPGRQLPSAPRKRGTRGRLVSLGPLPGLELCMHALYWDFFFPT